MRWALVLMLALRFAGALRTMVSAAPLGEQRLTADLLFSMMTCASLRQDRFATGAHAALTASTGAFSASLSGEAFRLRDWARAALPVDVVVLRPTHLTRPPRANSFFATRSSPRLKPLETLTKALMLPDCSARGPAARRRAGRAISNIEFCDLGVTDRRCGEKEGERLGRPRSANRGSEG